MKNKLQDVIDFLWENQLSNFRKAAIDSDIFDTIIGPEITYKDLEAPKDCLNNKQTNGEK